MSTSHPTTPCSSTTSSAAVESSPSPSSTRTSSSATIASPARTPAGSPSQWTPPSSTAPSAAPSPSRSRPATRPPPSRSSSSRSSPPAPATLPPFSPLRPKGGFPPLCRACPSPSPFPGPTCFISSRPWMLLKICLRSFGDNCTLVQAPDLAQLQSLVDRLKYVGDVLTVSIAQYGDLHLQVSTSLVTVGSELRKLRVLGVRGTRSNVFLLHPSFVD
ncbi:hypothetical protein ZIOFF_067705 [Zingiber officinale]|uniref:Uncharacterized protein n=1 Tax=Zingiber officinale TaxID=94328 RepID=A0A8J5BKF8_ZINOF|nr:hypothetical protein ZIOFF_067705 [Zingiber officinale]